MVDGKYGAAVKQAIDDNKDEFIALLKKMISFDSSIVDAGILGMEQEIQEFLAAEFNLMGAEVDVFQPDKEKIAEYKGYNVGHEYENRCNVVATFRGVGGGRSLLFNGHCDVVPAGATDKWNTDPFQGTVKDDRIYGRGSADMKGGSAAAICAIKLIKRLGLQTKGDIIFESVVDEEGGGNGTIACCDCGYYADGAIIMEPTSLAVMPCNRGAFLAEFCVLGRPVHAAMKGKGQNAIDKAIKLIGALKELESDWLVNKKHDLLANPTINIGTIYGGTGASTVPECCTVQFDVEFLPSELDDGYVRHQVDPNTVKAEVEEHIARACAGDSWLCKTPVKIKWYQETLCFETDIDSEFVNAVKNCVKEVLGEVELDGLPCGCDGAQLANISRMPVIILGPGEAAQLHTANESLSIKKFLDSVEIYAKIILDWVETK